jgi:hypothetical protein
MNTLLLVLIVQDFSNAYIVHVQHAAVFDIGTSDIV